MARSGGARWTFLTNHAHALLCIAENPDIRIREVADLIGITERAAYRIVADLVEEGYVTATKVGRRNSYTVDATLPFRHPLARDHHVGEIISVLGRPKKRKGSAGTEAG